MEIYAEICRKKIDDRRHRVQRVRKVLRLYNDARFVSDYVDEVGQLIDVVEERLQELVRLSKLEDDAGMALENSFELYKSMRRIYGAMLLYDVPDDLRRAMFPRGLPKATRIPVETLRVVGNRLVREKDGALADCKKLHPLLDEIRFHLEDSRGLAATEVSIGTEVTMAKNLLDQANSNLDSAFSVMFHLAKADNCLNPGIYRAVYPLEHAPDEVPLDRELEGDFTEEDALDDAMVMEGSEDGQ